MHRPSPTSASADTPAAGDPATTRVARRQQWAGVLLVLGGATLAAAAIVQPRGSDEELAVSLAESSAAWSSWGLLIMATALLQLPAVVMLRAAITSGPGVRLVAAGGGLTAASLVALFAFGQSHAEGATMVGSPPVSPELLEAFARTDSSVSLGVTAVLALIGFHLGWPLLLAGLARAGALPAPLAIVGGLAVLLSFFGAALGPLGEVALFVVAASSLAAVGLHVLRGSPPPS
ncbi:hypothetical protein SAMN04488570_0168 [Nocardioides scoriae]|uniref:DUF4386 family protein n=1 Tax=Nocardioides scoriae TaxID=642780 RepID=A0A1H1LES6_9ACTN|nr:hypothetical protein [Nocardioides scoriae]SDR72555.1 hypothetical protein SAMN04488570_0168 [Nocardioides scoriae]